MKRVEENDLVNGREILHFMLKVLELSTSIEEKN